MRVPVRSVQKLARIAAIAVFSWFSMSMALHITPAAAQGETVSLEFRTALEPYGSFRHVARWGDVWVPNDVSRDWRPYTVGHWVYSGDYGWYWVSDRDEVEWGWIAFHYGRWVWIDDLGWAWVPGHQRGPAWVDWRRGGGYVGWAPMPPDEIVVDVRDNPTIQPHSASKPSTSHNRPPGHSRTCPTCDGKRSGSLEAVRFHIASVEITFARRRLQVWRRIT